MDIQPSREELKAAWQRVPGLRFLGIGFERALATPLVARALTLSAQHRRRQVERAAPAKCFVLE